MKTRPKVRPIALICLTGCLIGSNALAQASGSVQSRVITNDAAGEEPAEASPARVAPSRQVPGQPARGLAVEAVPVDSVVPTLQGIVVLCATEPASPEFKDAWSRYIERHPVAAADLDALIDDVLERAEAYRAERSSNPRTNRRLTIMTTTRSMMHDTAMAVIRKIG